MRLRPVIFLLVWGSLIALGHDGGPASAAGRDQRERSAVGETTQVGEWLSAVDRHEPSNTDAPAILLATWSKDQLIPVLRALDSMNAFGKLNTVLVRGAVLHTDIAFRLPSKATGPLVRSKARTGDVLLATDGQERGMSALSFHLEFARAVLDMVRPKPSEDPATRLWYLTASAMLSRLHDHADAIVHLSRARQLFPDDADILFDSGCLYEVFAAPPVQAVVQARPGTAFDLPSVNNSIAEAIRYFRRAIANRPGHAEARMHLARLLGIRGNHAEAQKELERAIHDATDPFILYYAWMFLGNEHQAVQRFDAARDSYERARQLFPGSQSPAFALSQLARRRGDRRGALAAISEVLQLPQPDDERGDPWWRYYEGSAREAPALLEKLLSLTR